MSSPQIVFDVKPGLRGSYISYLESQHCKPDEKLFCEAPAMGIPSIMSALTAFDTDHLRKVVDLSIYKARLPTGLIKASFSLKQKLVWLCDQLDGLCPPLPPIVPDAVTTLLPPLLITKLNSMSAFACLDAKQFVDLIPAANVPQACNREWACGQDAARMEHCSASQTFARGKKKLSRSGSHFCPPCSLHR